jgi:hypothetical protein
MSIPLRDRDRLERIAKAYGEPVSPDDLPADLDWRVWRPKCQEIYFWTWARRDGCIYAREHDAQGLLGCWRLPLSRQVRQIWRAIVKHLGPMGLVWSMARASLACVSLA